MNKVKVKLDDLGVATAKTARFDEQIQNDNRAALTRVADKCTTMENLVINVTKNKDDAKVLLTTEQEQSEPHESIKKKKNVTWIGTSVSKVLDKKKFENDTFFTIWCHVF